MSLNHDQKLAFIHKMSKLGLDHVKNYDSGGGVISAGNSNPISGISGALTAQNSFQAGAPTSTADVGAQQRGLYNQLSSESAGNGPNPAQIQYQQNANQIAQNAATANSQNRALNPGLAARMSGNQAVSAQQVAAGTAAAQQAQQQLAAQQQLEGLTGQEQQGALGAAGINSQVAQNNTNSVNQQQQGLENNVFGKIPILGSIFGYHGGSVGKDLKPLKMEMGGSISVAGTPNFSNAAFLAEQQKDLAQSKKDSSPSQMPGGSSGGGSDSGSGPISGVGQFLNSQPTSGNNFGAGDFFSGSAPELGSSAGIGDAAASPELLAAAFKGGTMGRSLMKKGGDVKAMDPSQKAVVSGDSLKNDKVPAMLSQGELVIDRETMKDPGPVGTMARALQKHIEARNGKRK